LKGSKALVETKLGELEEFHEAKRVAELIGSSLEHPTEHRLVLLEQIHSLRTELDLIKEKLEHYDEVWNALDEE
jgi:hypothetical protein